MIRLLPWIATLVARTLRIRIKGELPDKCVIIFWHGKMFAGWYLAAIGTNKFTPGYPVALVSPSKDGEILTQVLLRWGYKIERGSSSKSGMEALERAIVRVRKGECKRIVITPDGPRGPLHRLKRGAFLAAQGLGLPVYFLRIHYKKARMLEKSWDRFEIPIPFSSVHARAEEIDLHDYPVDIAAQHEWLNALTAAKQL